MRRIFQLLLPLAVAVSVMLVTEAPPAGAATAQSSKQPAFPASLVIDGKTYRRLKGATLRQAVVGKAFCPDTRCTGIAGTVEAFYLNGNFGLWGDRWDDGGTYRITHGAVLRSAGHDTPPRTYAFYRALDGEVRKAWDDRRHGVQSSIVFVQAITP